MRNLLLSLFVSVGATILLAGFGVGQVPYVNSRKVIVSIDGGQYATQMVNPPDVSYPDEAKASGLGGLVRVQVTIGQTGVVLDAKVVSGPSGVCSGVTRSDVMALRRTAEDAARKVMFK